MVRISYGDSQEIIMENLNMCHVAIRFILLLLTPNQKSGILMCALSFMSWQMMAQFYL